MEFKKLSAVEKVATVSDTASVLIEENGVIKRAPKGEVGGVKVASTAEVGQTIVVKAVDEAGNPTEWECADLEKKPDMVITIACSKYATPTSDMITISSGSVNDVYDSIMSGRIPDVRVRFIKNDWETNLQVSADEFKATTHVYAEALAIDCVYGNWSSARYIYRLGLMFDLGATAVGNVFFDRVQTTTV